MKVIEFDITTVEAPAAIAHGVNCQNVMGSGVARALYEKWPRVKESYHEYPRKHLGAVDLVTVELGLVVANCFTQVDFGRDGRRYASTNAIETCMHRLAVHPLVLLGEVHLPKIGCGLGGLDWETEVRPTLLRVEADAGIEFIVCELGA